MSNKFFEGKLDFFVLPWNAINELVKVGMKGREKYSDYHTWRGGIKYSLLISAIFRHLVAFIRGENIDKESKCHHLAHVAFNALMLLEIPIQFDDRGTNQELFLGEISRSIQNVDPEFVRGQLEESEIRINEMNVVGEDSELES